MTFSELIRIRQSVRSYLDKPVEPWKVEALIESVRLAPSASNSQPWHVIIVDDVDIRKEVARATYSKLISFNHFVCQAPVLAVLVIEKPKVITQIGGKLKDREFPLIDIGIAASHLCLQAAELDLGTCMVGWFDEKKVQNLLEIPKKKRVGLIVAIGYSAEQKIRGKVRKSRKDMSSLNKYN